MDERRFDRLTRTLTEAKTRRGLLGVLAACAAAAAHLMLDDGESAAKRKRYRLQASHHSGNDKDNRNGQHGKHSTCERASCCPQCNVAKVQDFYYGCVVVSAKDCNTCNRWAMDDRDTRCLGPVDTVYCGVRRLGCPSYGE
jgi:hypothetical protein